MNIDEYLEDNPQYLTEATYLLGNGKSRKGLNLDALKPKGTVFGCNAIYRDYIPDFISAADNKMVTELIQNEVYKKTNIVLPYTRVHNKKSGLVLWDQQIKLYNTTGCFLMHLIGKYFKPKVCFMIGMDAYPGNVYEGTHNYPGNLTKFNTVLKRYQEALSYNPDTLYVNVNEKDTWTDRTAPSNAGFSIKADNYAFITLDVIKSIIPNL